MAVPISPIESTIDPITETIVAALHMIATMV